MRLLEQFLYSSKINQNVIKVKFYDSRSLLLFPHFFLIEHGKEVLRSSAGDKMKLNLCQLWLLGRHICSLIMRSFSVVIVDL